MKKISFKALSAALVLSGLVITTGCKKDENVLPDKSELLTAGPWRMSAMTVDPAIDWFGAPVANVFAQLPACLKDDLAIFKANGTVNYDEGPSKCDPNAPQTTTGIWSLNVDQTVLTITRDGETESWDLSTLSETTFKADYLVGDDGVVYTFSVTFVRE